jgi:hypothetical protein
VIDEEAVNDFLEHHGVKGMKKGFPKTNLDRISRVARGTSTLKANIEKAQAAALKKAEKDAVKVEAHDKATLVVDPGPGKKALVKPVQPPSTDEQDTGESIAKKLLEKFGATKVTDLSK